MKAGEDKIAWLRDYYDALDGGDYARAAEFLHEDIRTVYPRGDELLGRGALMKVSERSLGALERISHKIRNVWDEGAELVFELDVTYYRRDGEILTRAGIGIFVMDEERVREQRLYVDLTGIWD